MQTLKFKFKIDSYLSYISYGFLLTVKTELTA